MSDNTPFMIDEYTRVDKVEVTDGRLITIFNSLPGTAVEELDIPSFRDGMAEILHEGYRTDPNFDFFRRHNLPIRYQYQDMHGKVITLLEIPAESGSTD